MAESLRFPVLLLLIYLLQAGIYFLIPDQWLHAVLYRYLITEPCAWLLNLWHGNEVVLAWQHDLILPDARLQVVRGCDGSDVFFLLNAAVLAFRCQPRRTVAGLLAGMSIVYLLNTVRILVLSALAGGDQAVFIDVHTLIAPGVIIILTSLFFLIWTRWASRDETAR